MARVIKREVHSLPDNIRETKYLPNYQFDYYGNISLGAVIVISEIDGSEDVVNFCSVTLNPSEDTN
jgi:ribosomal protein L5